MTIPDIYFKILGILWILALIILVINTTILIIKSINQLNMAKSKSIVVSKWLERITDIPLAQKLELRDGINALIDGEDERKEAALQKQLDELRAKRAKQAGQTTDNSGPKQGGITDPSGNASATPGPRPEETTEDGL